MKTVKAEDFEATTGWTILCPYCGSHMYLQADNPYDVDSIYCVECGNTMDIEKENTMINKEVFIDETNGKLDELLLFAKNHPAKDSLKKCFTNLEKHYNSSEIFDKMYLFNDWSEHSLEFVINYKDKARTPYCGGIIYHDIGSNNFSVTLEPTYGWRIHT